MKRFKNNYLLLGLLTIFFPHISYSQNQDITSVFWHLKNTFKIETYKDGKLSKTGSGYILFSKYLQNKDFEYYAITNEHVLENSDSATVVLNNNENVKISFILDSYHELDITLFSFVSNLDSLGYFTFSQIAKKIYLDSILVGDNILTISSPKGLLNSLSNGIISAKRQINKKNYLQFTAPVSAGSSGGLVLNSKFLPIGVIVSQFSEGQNINFSVPLKLVLDSIKSRYSSSDLGKIVFKKYYVNELDDHIEMNFAESSSIIHDYSISPDHAYAVTRKYNLNELTHGILLMKMDYEIKNHLPFAYLESHKFYLKKFGNDAIITIYLLSFTSSLVLQESIDDRVISSFEDADPTDENSTKIFADFLRGVDAYKKSNYSYSKLIFSKLDDLMSSENPDTTTKLFYGSFGMSLYDKLGRIYLLEKNFDKAKDAELQVFVLASLKENKQIMGTSGSWVAYSYMKIGRLNAACKFYNDNLRVIRGYLISAIMNDIISACE